MNEKLFIESHIITEVIKWKKNKLLSNSDPIIREIPLQICINKSPYVTLMYTPGQEKELAMGFCFTEGILPDEWEKSNLQWEKFDLQQHTINLSLDQPSQPYAAMSPKLDDFFENSKNGDNSLNRILPYRKNINSEVQISLKNMLRIEKQIREKQKLFILTGATHAACVFDVEGNYLFCCEDIARHNALDKAIGHALLEGIVLFDKILCLTGRTNYTLMRKAACAQFPIVASISAPTSMAVKISKAVGMTLIGFFRSEEMNVYTGRERIKELRINED